MKYPQVTEYCARISLNGVPIRLDCEDYLSDEECVAALEDSIRVAPNGIQKLSASSAAELTPKSFDMDKLKGSGIKKIVFE